jgi:hypothetical protein
MLAVDLSALPQAHIGTEVTLWGQGPHGSLLSIDEVAWHAPLIRLRKPGTETTRPGVSLRMAKERSGGSARGS